jgi:pyruvate dehydrogenase E1 component
MVSHLTDVDLVNLPRGGHDYRKLYAAYKAATDNLGSGAPTVILCKTVKGWTLGPQIEGRNATHQIKKMNAEQLLALRDRLYLHDEIPDDAIDDENPPYFRPREDSVEFQYMMERRRRLGGSIPKRRTAATRPITLPADDVFVELRKGSGSAAVSRGRLRLRMGDTGLKMRLSRRSSEDAELHCPALMAASLTSFSSSAPL